MGKKFSYKLVKEIIENEGYELLSDSYENIHKKLEIKCPNNHIFKMSFNNFKNGQRCKKCSSKNKYLVEEINEIANKNGFTLLNKEKEFNMRTAILLENEAGEISSMTLYSFENKYIHKDQVKLIISNFTNLSPLELYNHLNELVTEQQENTEQPKEEQNNELK